MRRKLLIFDDFYGNPDRVRARAIASDYADIAVSDYPGFATRLRLESDTLERLFARLIGTDLAIDRARFTWGGFRFVTEASGRHAKVHADIAIDWAAMIYLTPDAPAHTGTAFFRHRGTGFEMPPSDREARAMGFSDAADFDDRIIQRDKADPSKWERIFHVAPVYNRLVLFRGGDFYHAPEAGCGDGPQTARLAHIFFFNEVVRPTVRIRAVPATLVGALA